MAPRQVAVATEVALTVATQTAASEWIAGLLSPMVAAQQQPSRHVFFQASTSSIQATPTPAQIATSRQLTALMGGRRWNTSHGQAAGHLLSHHFTAVAEESLFYHRADSVTTDSSYQGSVLLLWVVGAVTPHKPMQQDTCCPTDSPV
jgi:hypothetical protein